MGNAPIAIHASTNAIVGEILTEEYPEYTITNRLGTLIKESGLALEDITAITGIRTGTLSTLTNQKRTSLNLSQVLALAKLLNVTDITALFELKMHDETKEILEQRRKEEKGKGVTDRHYKMLLENRNRFAESEDATFLLKITEERIKLYEERLIASKLPKKAKKKTKAKPRTKVKKQAKAE